MILARAEDSIAERPRGASRNGTRSEPIPGAAAVGVAVTAPATVITEPGSPTAGGRAATPAASSDRVTCTVALWPGPTVTRAGETLATTPSASPSIAAARP